MPSPANWNWLIGIIVAVLGPIVRLISAKFRDELTEWVQKKYKEALATENPWDDFFFEFLAKLLGIPVSA